MTAKQQFFEQVLGGLKERSAYFSRDSIQAAADEAGLLAGGGAVVGNRSEMNHSDQEPP